jgi:hypothetical protein
MKRILLTCLLVLGLAVTAFPQAKKPTIMVVPSDLWCFRNGYMMEFDNQGTRVKIPDYKRALQENAELLQVISKINELMADRGFPLKNLESSLKSLSGESAEDAMLNSKSGAEVSESPIDKLKKIAKADIWMQLTWTINQTGPKRSITFNLQGLDAYTDKQIAGASGTGQPSFSAELPVLLEESVLANLDNFNSQLQRHFDDLFANGREITLRIKKFDSFNGDLETEFGGEELGKLIEDWVSDNTVQHRFSTADATENMMLFEQVRIPLYDANNRPVDARGWARDLQRMLKDRYRVDSKLMTKGLGQASIVVGEK